MKVPFVDLKAQYNSIKEEIDQSIRKIIDDSNFVGGAVIEGFEKSFAAYLGAGHCIACGNGTDALEIILKALNIGPGDEVIVPACSWISTSEAVSTVGAKPVFADVLPLIYTIDPKDIAKKISPNTKAIIPVHLYGLPAEMDEIVAIANQYKLKVIEDCAQSHGAVYKGKNTGTFGAAAAFSFYPGKNLGAYGDAGAIIANDTDLAIKMKMIGNHGQLVKHNHIIEGRNSRMDTLQAAILSTKLPYLKQWTKARQHNASVYNDKLQHSGLPTPLVPEYSDHVYHLYVVQVEKRAKVMEQLHTLGIQTVIHYPAPLPFLKAYHHLNYQPKDFPIAASQMDKILSLPMYPELSESQILYVCENLNEVIKH